MHWQCEPCIIVPTHNNHKSHPDHNTWNVKQNSVVSISESDCTAFTSSHFYQKIRFKALRRTPNISINETTLDVAPLHRLSK